MKYKQNMNHNWLILLIAMLSFTSCEKFLVHDSPTGVTDDDWWNTEADAYAAISSVYAGIPGGTSGRNVMYLSGMSDEAVHRGDFKGDYDAFTRGLQNSRWGVALNIWRDDYIDIRRANRFLENIDKAFMDSNLKERMKYEARALRAYYHMEMMLFFGDIPIVTKSAKPTDERLKRDDKESVYQFLVAELKECAANLPEKYDNSERWRMTSGVCWSLLTRLGLYHKDYEMVKIAATKIIDSKVYELHKSNTSGVNSYVELFTYAGELNKESIFFKENGASNAWTTFAPYGIGGETYLSPTNTVVNNYELLDGRTLDDLSESLQKEYHKNPLYNKNRDPRLAASIFVPGEVFQGKYILDPFNNKTDRIGESKSTATGYWIKKYIDPKDQQQKRGSLDFMIIRYAEVLLNYVEALVENNEWEHPDVMKYVNEIRSRASMSTALPVHYTTEEASRQLIRRERQSELAFEGTRYFDIRRWNIAEDVMNGDVYGATNPTTGEIYRVQTRSYNPNRDQVWPIPETEMIGNENMVQNPGY